MRRSRYSLPTGSDAIVLADTPFLIVAAPGSIGLAVAVTVTVSVTPWTDSVGLISVSWASWTCAARVTVCMPDNVKVTL